MAKIDVGISPHHYNILYSKIIVHIIGLRNHSYHLRTLPGFQLPAVFSADLNLTACKGKKAGHTFDQGRFACSIRAD